MNHVHVGTFCKSCAIKRFNHLSHTNRQKCINCHKIKHIREFATGWDQCLECPVKKQIQDRLSLNQERKCDGCDEWKVLSAFYTTDSITRYRIMSLDSKRDCWICKKLKLIWKFPTGTYTCIDCQNIK